MMTDQAACNPLGGIDATIVPVELVLAGTGLTLPTGGKSSRWGAHQ
jgi:hypothetical protein